MQGLLKHDLLKVKLAEIALREAMASYGFRSSG
jgi:hypothetical protein